MEFDGLKCVDQYVHTLVILGPPRITVKWMIQGSSFGPLAETLFHVQFWQKVSVLEWDELFQPNKHP